MPKAHMSLETLDRLFAVETLKNIHQVFFCGSYGDPIVHPNFVDIVRKLRERAPTVWIYIHTNGGVHDPVWWSTLANIIGDYGRIDFNIDGLADTNHLYRRNVIFDKVINNAQAFIKAGGKAKWNFIVFKHNQHQVDEARMLSTLIGFEEFVVRKTGRFLDHEELTEYDEWPVKNNQGQTEYVIEPPTIDQYRNASTKNVNIEPSYFSETKIKCDAMENKKVVITAEGLVLPCNFFEHNMYDARFYQDAKPGANKMSFVDGENHVQKIINKYRDEIDINKTSLERAMRSEFWTEVMLSWEKEIGCGRIFECAFTCGQKLTKVWDQNKSVTHAYRYYVTGNNRGLGKYLSDEYVGDGCSRSSGLDITNPDDIQKIAKDSLMYDVFINNAFDGPPDTDWANYGQVNLLQEVYKIWKENNKSGHIINISSVGCRDIVAPEPEFETYRVAKAALDYASKQCAASFKNGIVDFRTTLITLDRLDTELSRSRDNWTGNGVDLKDIKNFIDYLVSVKRNTVIQDAVFYVNFNHKGV